MKLLHSWNQCSKLFIFVMAKLYSIALIGFFAISSDVHGSKFFQNNDLNDFNYDDNWKEPIILNRNNLAGVELKYIEQPVDHFDASINGTYNMRYYENKHYFNSGGPIIIYLGGEWAISPNSLQDGFAFELTKEQNGVMFYTEHRYYGLSRPTEDLSSQNLRHLSVDQALADVAFFIQQVKQEDKYKKSPVIVIGGSYSANMAVWMRAKYPHLVQGALASSAPILAKADFYEYLEVVTKVLRSHGQQCVDDVKAAFKELADLSKTQTGLNLLAEIFNFCKPIQKGDKKSFSLLLAEILTDIFKDVSQYDRPDENGVWLSEKICRHMTNSDHKSHILRLAKLLDKTKHNNKDYYDEDNDCVNADYDLYVKELRNPSYGDMYSIYRQWTYQTCTEYGYFQTTAKDSIFGNYVGVDFYEQLCEDVFGKNYNKQLLDARIKRTNIVYGGREPAVTNVIFTNGSKDPWHALSRLNDLNNMSPSYFINGTSHCYDLMSNKPTDSLELKAVRKMVKADLVHIIKSSSSRHNI